jgi:hypothetical protein
MLGELEGSGRRPAPAQEQAPRPSDADASYATAADVRAEDLAPTPAEIGSITGRSVCLRRLRLRVPGCSEQTRQPIARRLGGSDLLADVENQR